MEDDEDKGDGDEEVEEFSCKRKLQMDGNKEGKRKMTDGIRESSRR